MTEYIEREAAIQALKAVPQGNWSRERYMSEIAAVPAADVAEKPQWISVNEQLLKAYKDTGLTPEEIKSLEAENKFLKSMQRQIVDDIPPERLGRMVNEAMLKERAE